MKRKSPPLHLSRTVIFLGLSLFLPAHDAPHGTQHVQSTEDAPQNLQMQESAAHQGTQDVAVSLQQLHLDTTEETPLQPWPRGAHIESIIEQNNNTQAKIARMSESAISIEQHLKMCEEALEICQMTQNTFKNLPEQSWWKEYSAAFTQEEEAARGYNVRSLLQYNEENLLVLRNSYEDRRLRLMEMLRAWDQVKERGQRIAKEVLQMDAEAVESQECAQMQEAVETFDTAVDKACQNLQEGWELLKKEKVILPHTITWEGGTGSSCFPAVQMSALLFSPDGGSQARNEAFAVENHLKSAKRNAEKALAAQPVRQWEAACQRVIERLHIVESAIYHTKRLVEYGSEDKAYLILKDFHDRLIAATGKTFAFLALSDTLSHFITASKLAMNAMLPGQKREQKIWNLANYLLTEKPGGPAQTLIKTLDTNNKKLEDAIEYMEKTAKMYCEDFAQCDFVQCSDNGKASEKIAHPGNIVKINKRTEERFWKIVEQVEKEEYGAMIETLQKQKEKRANMWSPLCRGALTPLRVLNEAMKEIVQVVAFGPIEHEAYPLLESLYVVLTLENGTTLTLGEILEGVQLATSVARVGKGDGRVQRLSQHLANERPNSPMQTLIRMLDANKADLVRLIRKNITEKARDCVRNFVLNDLPRYNGNRRGPGWILCTTAIRKIDAEKAFWEIVQKVDKGLAQKNNAT